VREPALVPRVFQQAFHLMRSGRPGPVLIDLPSTCRWPRSISTRYLRAAAGLSSRRHPRPDRKSLRHAQRGQRPLLTIGGGVINADAAALAVEFAELTGVR
jgi:tartronate-semialdehyde synthase